MSYYIVEHDGKVHQIIDKKGKPNKYGDMEVTVYDNAKVVLI